MKNISIRYGILLAMLLGGLNAGYAQMSEVIVNVTWPNWSSENRVEIVDLNGNIISSICNSATCYDGSANNSYSQTINLGCINDGNGYAAVLYDTYGDGWNGAASNITITSGGSTVLTNNGAGTGTTGTSLSFNVSGGGAACCTEPAGNFTWSSNPNGTTHFNWLPAGTLSNTYNNINGSGVNLGINITGETSTLNGWGGSGTSPIVGTNPTEGQEVLQFYTDGFGSTGITFQFTFSEPVDVASFLMYHINTNGTSGDLYTITATDVSGNTIYPTFISSANPSYSTNAATGTVDATGASTSGDNDQVVVSFDGVEGINSMTMHWQNCSTCSSGAVHGSGLGGFSFCREPVVACTNASGIDTDGDGIDNTCDLDDDNDGILDTDEGCSTTTYSAPNAINDLNSNISNEAQAFDGVNGNGARFNGVNDHGVVDLSTIVDAGTTVSITYEGRSNASYKEIEISQATNIGGTLMPSPNTVSISTNDVGTSYVLNYVLTEDTRYLLLDMVARTSGRINIDDVVTQDGFVCVDSDNDGVNDNLDTDSDNDGCPDAIEAAGSFVPASLDANDRLTGGVDSDGVPLVTSGGQATTVDVTDENVQSDDCDAIDPNDCDGDGIVNSLDDDDDNDGVSDVQESCDLVIIEDDFGAGTRNSSAFTTYCYEDGTGSCPGYPGNVQVNDGEYALVNLTNPDASNFPAWDAFNDHTGNTNGLMMVVNASHAPDEFYRRTLNIVPNVDADVDFWVRNIINTGTNIILPNVQVKIETMAGVQIGSVLNTGDIAEDETWHNYAFSFAPGNRTQVQIVLSNNGPGGGGNDLALDDITVIQALCDGDMDGDGIPNTCDLDSDGDCIPDAIEANGGTLPDNMNANGQFDAAYVNANDANGNGWVAEIDPADGGTQLPNTDTDGNLVVDMLDATAQESLIVSGTSTMTLSEDITVFGVTVESNATLDLNGFNLTLLGNMTIDGTLVTDNSTVTFAGNLTCNQTICGEITFHNLEVSNPNGVVVGSCGCITVANDLVLTEGTLDNCDADCFTLASNANGTAGILGEGDGDISCELTMERYKEGCQDGFMTVSSPLTTTYVSDWGDDLLITGLPGGPNSSFWTSIYNYDESVTTSFDDGWTPPASYSTAIERGLGYQMYVGMYDLPNKLIFSGTIDLSPFDFPITYTSTGVTLEDGYNLLGNPYPGAIDWEKDGGWTKVNCCDAIWVWNECNEQYSSYVGTVETNGGSNIVEPGEGFWVKLHQAGAQLSITKEAITDGTGNFNKTLNHNSFVKLHVNGFSSEDECVVKFDNDATHGHDDAGDAVNLASTQTLMGIYTIDDAGMDCSINAFPYDGVAKTIPVMIRVPNSGSYTMDFSNTNTIPGNVCMLLNDKLTGDIIDMKTTLMYTFNINTNNTFENRFDIVISYPLDLELTAEKCFEANDGVIDVDFGQFGNYDVVWNDINGNIVGQESGINASDFAIENMAPGQYIITVVDQNADYCSVLADTVIIESSTQLTAEIKLTDRLMCSSLEPGKAMVEGSGGAGNFTYVWNDGSTQETCVVMNEGIMAVNVYDANGCFVKTTMTVESSHNTEAIFFPTSSTIEVNEALTIDNLSIDAGEYVWDFGNGETSTEEAPEYSYDLPGTYDVTLTATKGNCESVLTKSIKVGIAAGDFGNEINVFESNGEIVINTDFDSETNFKLIVMDANGKLVYSEMFYDVQLGQNRVTVDKSIGTYLIRIETDNEMFSKKLYLK